MALMQDKEFDRAIKQKLESFSPAVPQAVWARIETALGGKDDAPAAGVTTVKPKRRPVSWLIAASVAGICCLGWLMSRPVEVIYLQGKGQAQAVAETAISGEPGPEKQAVAALPAAAEPFAPEQEPTHLLAGDDHTSAPEAPAVTAGRVVMLTEDDEIPHAALYQELSKVPLQTSISLGNEKPAVTKQLENVPVLVPSGTFARPVLQADRQLAERRPFGVSSLLNIVVGAVDGRQDKIITFTEDSEGTLFIDFNRGIAGKKK